MNIELIRKQLAELTALTESWGLEAEISAIERDLALDKVKRLYEELRFAHATPSVNEVVREVNKDEEEPLFSDIEVELTYYEGDDEEDEEDEEDVVVVDPLISLEDIHIVDTEEQSEMEPTTLPIIDNNPKSEPHPQEVIESVLFDISTIPIRQKSRRSAILSLYSDGPQPSAPSATTLFSPEIAQEKITSQEEIAAEEPTIEITSQEEIAQEEPTIEITSQEEIAQEEPTIEITSQEEIAQEEPTIEITSQEEIAQEEPTIEITSQEELEDGNNDPYDDSTTPLTVVSTDDYSLDIVDELIIEDEEEVSRQEESQQDIEEESLELDQIEELEEIIYDEAPQGDEDDVIDITPITIPTQEYTTPVLGDFLASNVETIADHFAHSNEQTPIISQTIANSSINDRYLIAQGLFGGNIEACEEMLEDLNAIENFDDCMIYIVENYDWNPDDEATKLVLKLLEQRFPLN